MRIIYLMASCSLLLSFCSLQKAGIGSPDSGGRNRWKLVFEDEFNTKGSFDTAKWSLCQRGRASWARFLTPDTNYVFCDGSNLILRMDRKAIPGDSVPYHCGGIKTQGKFSFLYGKIVVRAKFVKGKGSWPAIWMMPEKDIYGGWPKSGEIDIMEHVNSEDVVHQTIHNSSVTDPPGGSTATQRAVYHSNDYNLYGMVWTPDTIAFYVNDTLVYTYSKVANATWREWPFDQPFYLILNQSGGAGWPGQIKDEDLPFSLHIDWVRVYQEQH